MHSSFYNHGLWWWECEPMYYTFKISGRVRYKFASFWNRNHTLRALQRAAKNYHALVEAEKKVGFFISLFPFSRSFLCCYPLPSLVHMLRCTSKLKKENKQWKLLVRQFIVFLCVFSGCYKACRTIVMVFLSLLVYRTSNSQRCALIVALPEVGKVNLRFQRKCLKLKNFNRSLSRRMYFLVYMM